MTTKKDFKFLGEIGRGSFGKVDRVRRKVDGKECVCKQISLDQLKSQKQREQALNEAKIMRQLNCPYLVGYLDAFIEKDSLFLILEFCSGGDLKGYLKKAKALTDRSIWRYVLQIAYGLDYLHGKRILHRDLKSENIFLHGTGPHGPDEGMRVGDLGLARMLSNTQSGASTLVGTPRYLSPEEVKGLAHYNDKCDVWSLGVIVYELCGDSHKGPFDHASRLPELMKAILEESPPPLPQRLQDLKEVCDMLLQKDAAKRPSIPELLALQNCVEAAEKHGLKEGKEGGSAEGTATPVLVVQQSASSSARGVSNTVSMGSRGGAPLSGEVADNCCSRLAAMLGLRRSDVQEGHGSEMSARTPLGS